MAHVDRREGLELQMFDRLPLVDELVQRFDADADVILYKVLIYFDVAFSRFNSFWNHRLIAD